jgi:single-stranded-DNA-specific exonuclease
MQKKWRLADKYSEDFEKRFDGFHPLITQLLYNRKFDNPSDTELFFSPDYEKLHDPFLFNDMSKAVDRIWQAIENKEKILIHGDYDADGVTSSAIIYKAISAIDIEADIDVFIPHREKDGYGLNITNAKKFIRDKVKLIITVDCGITNVDEIAELTASGVDVIITDHHEPPAVLPDAFATIDQKVKDEKYPFKEISGAGVAYKLIQGVFANEKIKKYEDELYDYGGALGFLKWILDIVAIGTVADVVPLVDENRILVKWGLLVLEKTRNIGLKQLLKVIGNGNINSYTIGFQLAPRINAAGRLEHAKLAFDLLVSEDEDEAEKLAQELHQINLKRQKITEVMVEEARRQGAEQDSNIVFAYHKDWSAGVVGLVAGKLSDELYRPVIVMTDNQGMITGSGRSIEEFNIIDGLRNFDELFARYGGHSQACGFTLSSPDILDEFKQKLSQIVDEKLKGMDLSPCLDIESELTFSGLRIETVEKINDFEPFGEGNKKPLFLLKNIFITALDHIGENKNHLRLMVKQTDCPIIFKLLSFFGVEKWPDLNIGHTIDAVVEVTINEWNGNRDIEFKIVDLKGVDK